MYVHSRTNRDATQRHGERGGPSRGVTCFHTTSCKSSHSPVISWLCYSTLHLQWPAHCKSRWLGRMLSARQALRLLTYVLLTMYGVCTYYLLGTYVRIRHHRGAIRGSQGGAYMHMIMYIPYICTWYVHGANLTDDLSYRNDFVPGCTCGSALV